MHNQPSKSKLNNYRTNLFKLTRAIHSCNQKTNTASRAALQINYLYLTKIQNNKYKITMLQQSEIKHNT